MDNMQIEYRDIESLVEYQNNTRTHSDEQVAQIAASIREFGFTNPILIDGKGGIIAGHGRKNAARSIGLESIPCIVLDHLNEKQRRALVIADNKIAENSGWDETLLEQELRALSNEGFQMDVLGFDAADLESYFNKADDTEEPIRLTDADDVPDLQETVVTQPGDLWLLGPHRVMCGDSTDAGDIERLMQDAPAADVIHADPPYGMGKQADGVANDNLYREKLDAFQMAWWRAFRPYLVDNASAYIWGNPKELWRLWYQHLHDTETMELRNQIVWDKKSIAGMKSEERTQYSVASEHCLFIQIGKQYAGNLNTEDYPEEWEVVRGYLAAEAEAVGLKAKQLKEICGCGMFSHWFTKSQFTLIPQKHYKKLQAAFPGQFEKPWSELKRDWDRFKPLLSQWKRSEHAECRSYFDNTHDVMRDVWEFGRVTGAERYDHATPKPVAMMERVLRSSCPPEGLCLEPFAGTGSTLMGAENSGRVCFTMELQPKYCDVVVRRWQEYTGLNATRAADGVEFNVVAASG